MRKRIIHIGAVSLFALGLLTSCDLIEECGNCELVTEAADGTITKGTPLPTCGDDLKEKEDSSPVKIGGSTTYWNCY
jgi:hypothetical protein